MRIRNTRLFAIIPALILMFTRSKWEEDAPLLPALLYLIGLHLTAVAVLGRMWCSLYIAGNKDVSLVQEGPYSLSRNPLYFFSLVGIIGIGFATETLTVPILLAASFLVYYPFIIRREERKLLRLFPDEFGLYCSRVPRFFPRLGSFNEPNSCTIMPQIYRKHIFSALWFILIVGWIEFAEELHELGLVPVFFHLY